jgi:CNT family concentrative nucleoside transporter
MRNLVSLGGVVFLLAAAWAMSEDRRRFPWRVVGWGLALQFGLGFLVLSWEPGARFFLKLNDVFNALLGFSKEGAVFVFNSVGSGDSGGALPSLRDYLTRLGAESRDPVVQQAVRNGTVPGFFFAFQVLTTIIFFSALLSVLYYLGVMQKVVLLFAKVMSRTMGVSGAESLSNSANIFVGQTEAPLVVRPYIEKMTRSELMSIMVGGFSNTAGGVLGAYVLMLVGFFPNIASHLIAASLLSAPAAFVIAKIMVPEKETPLTRGEVRMEVEIEDANVIDAAANGTTVGWQLAINVGAMLVSFVAMIAMANLCVSWFGGFFRDGAGLVRFDLMVGAVVLSLVLIERLGPPAQDTVWWMLGAVAAAYVALRALGFANAAAVVGLLGVAAWLPVLLQAGRPRTYGRRAWIAVAAAGAVATAVYLVWGPLSPDTRLSLQLLLGWLHWPVAYLMGVPPQDCLVVGRLLGEKLILTEFVAYLDLSSLLGAASRGEIPALDPRSLFIVSYALCGFANVASIGIQIGGISPLAPSRRHEIARLGFKAMVGGALATFLIACVAGVFYSGRNSLGAPAPAASPAPASTPSPTPAATPTPATP